MDLTLNSLKETRLAGVSRLIDYWSDVGASDGQRWILSGSKRVSRRDEKLVKVAEREIVLAV